MTDNTPRDGVEPASADLDTGADLDTDTAVNTEAIDASNEPDVPTRRPVRSGWLSSLVAVIFGLFFAYYLWDAIRSMVELPKNYTDLGLTTADVPWWLLIVGVAVPPLVYLLAYLIGRRRNLGIKALTYFAGLAAVAALSLAVIAVGSRVLTTLLGPAGGL